MSIIVDVVLFSLAAYVNAKELLDENGYVMYCPCMGRFGNQADHLLGSLAFAKKLNRTLVVPPWIGHEYSAGYDNSFTSFSNWFNFEVLKTYHKVIPMEAFMENMAEDIWPPQNRIVYCYKIALERSKDKKSCPAKEGNPFKPFWDHFGIDFVKSVTFPASVQYMSSKQQWDKAFPASEHPVLALMGAPASYPVQEEHRTLQKYIEWSDKIASETSEFIEENIRRPFVGIHLRNGVDWVRACQHVGDGASYSFMSSPQCTGYGPGKKLFTQEMCLPTKETILAQTLQLLQEYNAQSLYIATDNEAYEKDFENSFKADSLLIDVVRIRKNSLEKDLAVLIEADAFIGSCASSVTAFVVRKRMTLKRPNYFFGVFEDKRKTEL